MRSTNVLDRPPYADAPPVQDLLVLWQHPTSRQIIPIGRFMHHDDLYTFSYTQAAADITDFRPLPGLGDLNRMYASTRIPAAFHQRVMGTDRPDFAAYIATIGLDPSNVTPWEQIVESGGARAGDTLQFMQIPAVCRGRARARFLANGVRYISDQPRSVCGRTVQVTLNEQETALQAIEVGDVLLIEAEDDNPVDTDAALIMADGIPVGWVPRALSASVRQLLKAGPVSATVERIGAPGTPSHLRLVLALDVSAPAGFEFDPDQRWEPLATQ